MNLANETRKGMVENARRGFHNGGSAPYGYRNHRFDHNGVIKSIWVPGSEEEVATVKRIYHLYVYEGMGYKKIARLLNEEGIPCPSGDKWSYTTIWHILHNEAYIGNRVWNKQDYQTPGKKYKPEDQWIRVTNAHPALVTQEMFNLVKTKSQQRIRASSPFVATGSPYILRGLFKCPRCGSNMVSGQGGGRGGYRNIRRYYVCGAYQRKGNTVCQFQAFKKDYLEDLVIDTLIKEFIILSLPGTLEEEVKRQLGEKLKNLRFDLQQTENDISFSLRRIELLQKDIDRVPDPGKLNNYLNELETELQQLNTKKSTLLDAIDAADIKDTASLGTVVGQLQDFVRNIREIPKEAQSHLLRQYINEITYDNITQLLWVSIKVAKLDGETIIPTKDSYVKYAQINNQPL
ncbi:MAG: Recombinase [Pelotomaculum sp. PtaB.Bin013]|nr:MAG: Recombinase [Pelotomaculum sp. PtaB.Bin013]